MNFCYERKAVGQNNNGSNTTTNYSNDNKS